MSVQRTFKLIPPVPNVRGDSPERADRLTRPMTSKQVRKAYKARTPSTSRAEMIRQEKAEQERIRREFEREKAAARAKLAREKKKDKELAERERKRKKGLPVVSVRPSQDTIARFARGNRSGREMRSAGRALGERREGDGNAERVKVAVEARVPHGRQDELTGLGTLLVPTRRGQASELDLIPEDDESDLETLLDMVAKGQDGPSMDLHYLQLQSDTGNVAAVKPPTKSPQEPQQRTMPPPFKPSSPSPQRAQLRKRPQTTPASPPDRKPPTSHPLPPCIPQAPPMSTQAILRNLDDFFPSSSQQARELQDDLPNHRFPHPSRRTEPTIAKQPPRQHTPNYPACPACPPPAAPPPRRFFTSSGSNELVSLAIQRSRRTAALQELQEQDLSQTHLLIDTWNLHTSSPHPSTSSHSTNKHLRPKSSAQSTSTTTPYGVGYGAANADKENTHPKTPPGSIGGSQETEYGGEWVDELALDIII